MYDIAVDIDGTICWRNVKRFLQVCNTKLQFGIEEKRLETLTYDEFLQQPEVLAYRQKWGEERAQLAIRWIDLDPEVLVAVLPIPGAVEGVQRLTGLGKVTYWTARYTPESAETSQAMADATRQWLREQHFPFPEEVIFCESPQDKLIRIAERSEAEDLSIILVDDRYSKLLEVAGYLDNHLQTILRRRVTILAFRAISVPEECYDISVIPFRSWKAIDTIIERFAVSTNKEVRHGIIRYAADIEQS